MQDVRQIIQGLNFLFDIIFNCIYISVLINQTDVNKFLLFFKMLL